LSFNFPPKPHTKYAPIAPAPIIATVLIFIVYLYLRLDILNSN
jgi:hypothetical protein